MYSTKIKKFINEDLAIYPNYSYPISKTVVNDNLWRHYELGPAYGFIIYNETDDCNHPIKIASIELNSHGNWIAPEDPMNFSSMYFTDVYQTFERALCWYQIHIIYKSRDIISEESFPKFKLGQICKINTNSQSSFLNKFPYNEELEDDLMIISYSDTFFRNPAYNCKNLNKGWHTLVYEELLTLKK